MYKSTDIFCLRVNAWKKHDYLFRHSEGYILHNIVYCLKLRYYRIVMNSLEL